MFRATLGFLILLSALVACSSAATPSPTAAPSATVASAAPTSAPATNPTLTPASGAVATSASATTVSVTASPASSGSTTPTPGAATTSKSLLTFTIVPAQSDASFTAREQLASRDLPSDAVGTTKQVTGTIVLDPTGAVVSDQSKIVVDLASLKTDNPRRDNFIKQNTLQTEQYPTATFVPTKAVGLPSPLPTSGTVTFQLVGNMTIHGTTKPMTWNVNAQVDGNNVTGKATTSFNWSDFGLDKPHVAVVLSVEDTVKLQADLHLTAAT